MFQLLIGTNIPFMKYRRIMYVISGLLVAATAAFLIVNRGPRYSVDFTGGELLQVRASRVMTADEVRKALDAESLRGYELQQMSGANANEFLIRARMQEGVDLFAIVQRAIESHVAGVKV